MKIKEILNEQSQERVFKGSEAQQIIEKHLSEMFGDEYQLVDIAPPASKRPDLIANIQGDQIQFEIKRRDSKSSLVKMYEKSVGRGDNDRILDGIAKIYTDGQAKNFTQLVDLLRKENPAYGFPGDKGVSKSGSIWLKIDTQPYLSKIRSYILTPLKNEGNHYFAVYDQSSHSVLIYHTGLSPNLLGAPRIPNINTIVIDTYGGQYKGRMRAAVKVRFSK